MSAGATASLEGGECSAADSYLQPYLARKADPDYCPTCGIKDPTAAPASVVALAEDSESAIGRQAAPLSAQPPLPQACFVESMKMRPSGRSYHYATCETNQSKTKDRPRLPPPCVTDSLVKPMQSALAQTMSCLGVDQREVFSLFGWESHYQVNLHNPGGIGVGQLTTIAIVDTDYHQHFAGDVNKQECKQFASVFDASEKHRESILAHHGIYQRVQPCEMLAQPDNPARNLLYAGAIYRDDKVLATKLASRVGSSSTENSKIAIELARYMYSMSGPGNILKLFRLWELREHPGRMTANRFKAEFRAFLKDHSFETNPKTGHRQRLVDTAYTKNVDTHARKVEQETGGKQCSE
jgi:hypothetical protein